MWKKNVASGTYDTPISISMAEAHMRLRDAFQEAVAKEAATLARQIIDTHREELVALIEHDFTDLLKAAVTEVIVARIFPGK